MYEGNYFNYPAIIGCDIFDNCIIKIDYPNHSFSVKIVENRK